MRKGPLPRLNAMLICDQVITEVGTNKKSLIGVFEIINVRDFPCMHPFLAVYVKLTDAKGEYKFKLELVDLKENLIIGRGEMIKPIKIEDPRKTYELVFNLNGLLFEHEGEYEFRLFANNKIFGQKTFLVRKVGEVKQALERGY